jgi:uncharacterized protein (TIGR00251 family)
MTFSSFWQDGSDVKMRVNVHAGAKTDALVKEHDNALRVDIKEAPEGGAANAALIRFFAKLLGKPVADIEVKHGHVSRNKVLVIHNCAYSDIIPIVLKHLRSVAKS